MYSRGPVPRISAVLSFRVLLLRGAQLDLAPGPTRTVDTSLPSIPMTPSDVEHHGSPPLTSVYCVCARSQSDKNTEPHLPRTHYPPRQMIPTYCRYVFVQVTSPRYTTSHIHRVEQGCIPVPEKLSSNYHVSHHPARSISAFYTISNPHLLFPSYTCSSTPVIN